MSTIEFLEAEFEEDISLIHKTKVKLRGWRKKHGKEPAPLDSIRVI